MNYSWSGAGFVDPVNVTDQGLVNRYTIRKEVVKDYFRNVSIEQGFGEALVRAEAGLEFTIADLDIMLEEMPEDQNPDFMLTRFVRLMHYTDELDDQILSVVRSFPLWLTEGEDTRLYWSENHMIMYSSCSLLLKQKFGSNVTYPEDPVLEERIKHFLRLKVDQGYYEYYSQVYLKFTLRALVNLYDFAEDAEIVSLAEQAILRMFEEWAIALNTAGFANVPSGRTSPNAYATGDKYSGTNMILELFSGFRGLLEQVDSVEGLYEDALVFLAQSDIDITPALRKFTISSYETLHIGNSYEESLEIFSAFDAPDFERVIFQWTSGGYANTDYVIDTVNLIDEYDMWEHKFFKPYLFTLYFPRSSLSFLSNIVATVTAASITDIDSFKVWKHHGAQLSCLENFFPGHKGFQQLSWAATTGDASVFSISVDMSNLAGLSEIDNYDMNNNLPYVAQDEHVGLVMYNPNADTKLFGFSVLDVLVYFDLNAYENVEVTEDWMFGERQGAYVAFNPHCMNPDAGQNPEYWVCHDAQEISAVVMGHASLHGEFSEFINKIQTEAIVSKEFNGRCITGEITFDGKTVKHEFCRKLGTFNAVLVLAFLLPLLVWLICACCCRNKLKKPLYQKLCLSNCASKCCVFFQRSQVQGKQSPSLDSQSSGSVKSKDEDTDKKR